MKKVAILFLLIIPLCSFGQRELSINTDLGSVTDTCVHPFRANNGVYISFDFTDLRSDTTELTIYKADWDNTLRKYTVAAITVSGVTWPLVLSKATSFNIFDVDMDGDDDTTSVKGFSLPFYNADAFCWRTTKQDSGTYVVRITK
jgi:hypothetical protein